MEKRKTNWLGSRSGATLEAFAEGRIDEEACRNALLSQGFWGEIIEQMIRPYKEETENECS